LWDTLNHFGSTGGRPESYHCETMHCWNPFLWILYQGTRLTTSFILLTFLLIGMHKDVVWRKSSRIIFRRCCNSFRHWWSSTFTDFQPISRWWHTLLQQYTPYLDLLTGYSRTPSFSIAYCNASPTWLECDQYTNTIHSSHTYPCGHKQRITAMTWVSSTFK
jgi:hypothetical protein